MDLISIIAIVVALLVGVAVGYMIFRYVVKGKYNQMVEAEALLESDYASLDMAQENYRIASLNYEAGMNTITDVLEANALLLQAQNAITDREITYVSARRRYHDLTGK